MAMGYLWGNDFSNQSFKTAFSTLNFLSDFSQFNFSIKIGYLWSVFVEEKNVIFKFMI